MNWLTPLDGLALYTSFGLADARYTGYPCAPAPSDAEASEEQQPNAVRMRRPWRIRWPTTGTDPESGRKAIVVCAEVDGGAQSDLHATLAPLQSAMIGVDLLYRGKRYLNPDNDERKAQPSTTLINARIGLGDLTKNWRLLIVGHNLTDKIILDQAVDQPLAPGNIAVVRGDHGRHYTANLSITF